MKQGALIVVAVLLLAPFAVAETPVGEAVAGTPAAEDDPGMLQELRKDVDGLLEKLNLSFYGHIKLDSSRDSAETNFGNTAFYVQNYGHGDKDEEINITARHTRFGLDWKGPEFEGIKAFAKIEIDFLGKAVQKNTETMELQGAVRLRLAWMRFDFADGWSVQAGQAPDVFAPVNMKKANTMVGWGQGNIGYRRPQLRVSKKIGIGVKSAVTAAFAVARPVARDSTKLDGDTQDDGEDSGLPDLQAHVGLAAPLFCDKPAKIGIGGFVGWREVGGGTADLVEDEHYRSWGICLDFVLPVMDCVSIAGELWTGEALDGYRGGVWQSYVVADSDVKTISATGGFLNVVYVPRKEWTISVGAGIDDPDDDDFHGSDGRYENTTLFANVGYSFYPGATVTVEYDRMQTDYRDFDDRTNHRVQISFMLKF